MSKRILIVDVHVIFREGLIALLEQEQNLDVVGDASDGICAYELAKELHPDIIVMGVVMPKMNGVEAARKILSEFPRVKIIALSAYSDKGRVLEMLRAGAAGYLLKKSPFSELLKAIDVVSNNQRYLDREITSIVLDEMVSDLPGGEFLKPGILTSREREILQHISEGLPSKVIASNLGLSARTIDSHRRNIMQKLDLYSLAELTKYAIREGLTSVD